MAGMFDTTNLIPEWSTFESVYTYNPESSTNISIPEMPSGKLGKLEYYKGVYQSRQKNASDKKDDKNTDNYNLFDRNTIVYNTASSDNSNNTSVDYSKYKSGKPNDNLLAARNFLMKEMGFTKAGASAFVGNLAQESAGNLGAVSKDGYGSYGLAQWTGSRKKKLFNMSKTKSPNLQHQLAFLKHELETDYKDVADAMRNASDLKEATMIVRKKFERPAEWAANDRNRLKQAGIYFNID